MLHTSCFDAMVDCTINLGPSNHGEVRNLPHFQYPCRSVKLDSTRILWLCNLPIYFASNSKAIRFQLQRTDHSRSIRTRHRNCNSHTHSLTSVD